MTIASSSTRTFSTNHWILPLVVFGTSSTKMICRGKECLESCLRRMNCCSSEAMGASCMLHPPTTTVAKMTSPRRPSGFTTTATSATFSASNPTAFTPFLNKYSRAAGSLLRLNRPQLSGNRISYNFFEIPCCAFLFSKNTGMPLL